jgi:cysteine dioxygenase
MHIGRDQQMITIDQFVEGLCNIQESDFDVPNVHRYVLEHQVDPDSLALYLLYAPTHYTRNLIYKCELFELMTICWEVGQCSRIHNHQNQNCWMAVPIGRLVVQNYQLIREDPATGFCELREADRARMDCRNPSFVRPEMPIHAALNLPEHGQQATSLHIYSRPYDHCLVYSMEKKSCCDVPLAYDTEFGRLVRN